jgi:hypothetical protein
VTLNEIGTRVQCPCGEWLGLTLTVGKTERRKDGSITLPLSFDTEQFKQDFEDHIVADPENEQHAQFVVTVDG